MVVRQILPVVVDLADFALQFDMLPVAHPKARAFSVMSPAHLMLRMSVHDAVKAVSRGQGNAADLADVLRPPMRHNFYSGIFLKNAYDLSVTFNDHFSAPRFRLLPSKGKKKDGL